jgi:WD40 repeat protein
MPLRIVWGGDLAATVAALCQCSRLLWTGSPHKHYTPGRSPREERSAMLRLGLTSFLSLVLAALAQAAGPPALRTDQYGDWLPPGALARLGTVRLRPGSGTHPYRGVRPSPVAFAVSPDGKLLATGGWDKLRVWDLGTGRELRSFEVRRVDCLCFIPERICFSPDGKRLAVICSETEHGSVLSPPGCWGLYAGPVNGQELRPLAEPGFGEKLQGLHFLAHDRLVVNQKGNVLVFDVTTAKVLHKYADATAHACSADGTMLATAKGPTIRLRHLPSGKVLRELKGHTEDVRSLTFSPDGKFLASGAGASWDEEAGKKKRAQDMTVRLWDVSTGKQRACWKGHRFPVCFVQFSPDGRTLVSADRRERWGPPVNAFLWDVGTGKLLSRFRGIPGEDYFPVPMAFSPDGKSLAVSQGDAGVLLWDIVSRKERRRYPTGPAQFFYIGERRRQLEFSSDGRLLIDNSEGLRIWDVQTGKEQHAYESHRTYVEELVFSPDGRTLASRDARRALRLWDVRTGKPLPPFLGSEPHRVHRFGFTADGKHIAAVRFDGTALLWDLRARRKVSEFRVFTAATVKYWRKVEPESRVDFSARPDAGIVFGPGCRVLAVAAEDEHVHLWDMATGKRIVRLKANQGPWAPIVFSPNGALLVTDGTDADRRGYRIGKEGPDGAFVPSRRPDGGLRLWALPSGKLLRHVPPPKGEEAGSVAFSPDSSLLAWSWRDQIELWDVGRGRRVGGVQGHRDGIDQLVFDRDGKTLVAVSSWKVWLWDTASCRKLHVFRGQGLSVSPNGRAIVSAAQRSHFKATTWRTKKRTAQEWAPPPQDSLVEATTRRTILSHVYQHGSWASSADDRIFATLVFDTRTFPGTDLFESATGSVVGRMPDVHRDPLPLPVFSPDGKMLALGGLDGSIILCDLARTCGLVSASKEKLAASDLARLWDDLASADARIAYRAIGTLAADPEQALPFLRDRLRPVTETECRPVRKLLADLASDDFARRERAVAELAKLSAEWLPEVYRVLAGKPSPEAHRRLRSLLAGPHMTRWSPGMLQRLRGVHALERIGTPPAQTLLKRIAKGVPEARLTQDAEDALRRLQRQP